MANTRSACLTTCDHLQPGRRIQHRPEIEHPELVRPERGPTTGERIRRQVLHPVGVQDVPQLDPEFLHRPRGAVAGPLVQQPVDHRPPDLTIRRDPAPQRPREMLHRGRRDIHVLAVHQTLDQGPAQARQPRGRPPSW